nr:GHKL domain-containing protein [Clostridia bacterium]
MNISKFTAAMLSCYAVLPAAIMCLAPMKHRLRYSIKKTAVLTSVFCLLIISLLSFIEVKFELGYYTLFPLLFLLTFFCYHISLRVSVCKSLVVYSIVVVFISFLANFSKGYDALLHPDSTLQNFSPEAALFQAFLVTASVAAVIFPFQKYGSIIVDKFDLRHVWYTTLPISWILLIYNLLISPRKYETMYVNNVFLFFWISLSLLMILLGLLCILFYFIVSGMMQASEAREKNRLLEMQEKAYITQQQYLQETARVRHDFKHALGTLQMLVHEGDINSVQKYLDDYAEAQPQSETVAFCRNTAVNALLNYYLQMAAGNEISSDFEINLPDSASVSDIDLCGILGNILENAIIACGKLSPDARFIDLVLRTEGESVLYIVATNSFDGKVRKNGDTYLSTA